MSCLYDKCTNDNSNTKYLYMYRNSGQWVKLCDSDVDNKIIVNDIVMLTKNKIEYCIQG